MIPVLFGSSNCLRINCLPNPKSMKQSLTGELKETKYLNVRDTLESGKMNDFSLIRA
jgi:hypothetical protein